MTDISTTESLWLIPVAIAAMVAIYFLVKKLRSLDDDRPNQEERERKEAAHRKEQVRAGTHDQHGHRLCITCNDGHTRATQKAFKLVQAEGVPDLVRRQFGAPARYTIEQAEKGELVYCDDCAVVVRLEHEDKLLNYESGFRSYKRDAAIELQRWFKGGCNDVVARRIREHDRQVRADEPLEEQADVIDLPSSHSGI